MGLIENPTQCNRILKILTDADGEWVDGMLFLRLNPPITQSKARMFTLKERGYNIEGQFIEGRNWKEYRLVKEPKQSHLLNLGNIIN